MIAFILHALPVVVLDRQETLVRIMSLFHSLGKQQLIGRIRLFGEVPLCTVKLTAVPGGIMSILQSFEEELVKERLWLLPTAVPRWPYESKASAVTL